MSYLSDWEGDHLLSPWLCKDPSGADKAWCNLCKRSLYPKKENLQRHTKNKKHIELIDKSQKNPPLNDVNDNNYPAVGRINPSTEESSQNENDKQSEKEVEAIHGQSTPNESNARAQQNAQKANPLTAIGIQTDRTIQHKRQIVSLCEDSSTNESDGKDRQIVKKIRSSTASTSQNEAESMPQSSQVEVSSDMNDTQNEINVDRADPSGSDTLGVAILPGNSSISHVVVRNTSSNNRRMFMPTWKTKYPWLDPIDGDPLNGFCTTCKKEISAYETVISKHKKTWKHRLLCGEADPIDKLDLQEAMNQIELSVLWAYRAVPFLFANYAYPTFQRLYYDSVIMENTHFDRIIIPLICRNVVAPCVRPRLVRIFRRQKIKPGLLADESTDYRATKALCLMTRYPDPFKKRIVDSLWDFIREYDGDEYSKADAKTLAEKIKKNLAEMGLTIKDFLFFCSDGASVFRGILNSVIRILQEENPFLEEINCTCHVQHLCSQKAIGALPSDVQNISSEATGYFSASEKRGKKLTKCQKKMGNKPLAIVKCCPTRWLEVYRCMERLYELWSNLLAFFTGEVKEQMTREKNKTNEKKKDSGKSQEPTAAQKLLRYSQSPLNKAIHAFVLTQLVEVYNVQGKLQSQNPVVTVSGSIVLDLFIKLLIRLIDNDYIMNIGPQKIDPRDKNLWKKQGVDLDPYVAQQVNSLSKTDQEVFKNASQGFLSELCEQYRQRFDFRKDLIEPMKCLHPKNALSSAFHRQVPDLSELSKEIPGVLENDEIRLQAVNNEWKKLILPWKITQDIINEKETDTFWFKISEVEDEAGNLLFENVSHFALQCLCIPNSNAPPERAFSAWHWQLNRLRASMHFDTVTGVLLTRSYVLDVGYENFEVTEEMFRRMATNLHDPFKDEFDLPKDNTYMGIEIPEWLCQNSSAERGFCARLRGQSNSANPDTSHLHDGCRQMIYKSSSMADVDSSSEVVNLPPNEESPMASQNDEVEMPEEQLLTIMQNGLFSNYQYYFTRLVYYNQNRKMDDYKNYLGGIFQLEGRQDPVYVWHHDLYGFAPTKWLTSTGIDVCTTLLMRNWPPNVTFLRTEVTFFFFKENFDIRQARDGHTVFRLDFPDQGLVFMPYLNEARSHWLLFILNFEDSTCAVIDSFPESENLRYVTEERRIMLRFMNYINECKRRSVSNALTRVKSWKLVRYPSHNRPLQRDSWNCGPFVIWEMDTLAKTRQLSGPFNPVALRVSLIKMLLEESSDITALCIYCYGEDDGPITVCPICQRFYHHRCLEMTEMQPTEICWPCLLYTNGRNQRIVVA